MANTDINIQTNVPPDRLESRGIYNPFRTTTRVYLTLPDGTRAGFTFTPVLHQQSGLIFYTPAWHADPGITYTLSSAYGGLGSGCRSVYDLAHGPALQPRQRQFGRAEYTLTAPDGTV